MITWRAVLAVGQDLLLRVTDLQQVRRDLGEGST